MPTNTAPPVPFSRTVAYLRKSRTDGEESVEEVLARHERILQDYAVSTWGVPLPESRIFREVQSGETIAARPSGIITAGYLSEIEKEKGEE